MSRSTLGLSTKIEEYLNHHSAEHPVLTELRRVTDPLPQAPMQIAPSQGTFLRWVLLTLRAKRTIEVGVFTGYSSLVTALALPEDGYLLACDVNKEWTDIARSHYKKAGVADKVDLVLGNAVDTLKARIVAGESGSYDFAFIDADKENYETYFELCLRLVRTGGVLMFDNTLWGGSVADKSDQRLTTRSIRRANLRITRSAQVESSLIPVGDGLMLATKK